MGLNAAVYQRSSDATVVERRIGNVAEIGVLRREVGELLTGTNSLILAKVLYSGSHSGDQIDHAELPRLKSELGLLDGAQNNGVTQFLSTMKELVSAAEAEGAPIVFV